MVLQYRGVSTATIYTWLETSAKSAVNVIEPNKLKKENTLLKSLLGELTLKLSTVEKGVSDHKENKVNVLFIPPPAYAPRPNVVKPLNPRST